MSVTEPNEHHQILAIFNTFFFLVHFILPLFVIAQKRHTLISHHRLLETPLSDQYTRLFWGDKLAIFVPFL
jgi:hypothetical protein